MIRSIFRPMWVYRGFILGSVKRDFQSKYRNSLLGAAWNVLNPLAMIVVYTVIFSQVMKAKLPGVDSAFGYSIYLCAGVITWGLFAEISGRAQNMFLDNANLLKKLNFPRLCLPAIVVLTALVNFSIIFGLFSGFLLVTGNFPGWTYLALIPLLIIQVTFAIGLGITVGILNVFFRDVGQLFSVVVQFWFWLTPVVYPVAILPETFRRLMDFNPMVGVVTGYQSILVNGEWPKWQNLWFVTLLSIALCGIALKMFRSRAGEMVDEL